MASGCSASAFGLALRIRTVREPSVGELERVQIAQVEALIAERRSETEAGEVVGHVRAPFRAGLRSSST
jgi:hypothetical protein